MKPATLRRRALILTLALAGAAPAGAHTRITTDITWGNDVRAILREHCMRCHRPSGIAPAYADFTTYGTDSQPGARAWATAIEEEILTGRMPPWSVDARFDRFRNSRTLSPREIDVLVAWVEGGAPQGPRRNLPPPPELLEDWLLGTPDLVVTPADEHVVPADRAVDRARFSIPVELDADGWITGYELRSQNPRFAYRITAFIVDPKAAEPERLELEVQVPYDPFRSEDEPEPTRWRAMPQGRRFLGQWLRGDEPVLFPDSAGRRLRRGSILELEVEYWRPEHENAAEVHDRPSVGLYLARAADEVDLIVESERAARDVRVRGRQRSKPVSTALTLREDARLIGLSPNVGRLLASLEIRATYPDQRSQTLLLISEYRAEWPASFVFAEPLEVAAGTRLEMIGTFREAPTRAAVAQPFELMVDYTLTDHLVLPPPEPQPRVAGGPRGGMLVDVLGGDLAPAAAPSADPTDPNAAAHMDHTPLHGGQFFMAANNYHHLEGALPAPGEFRLYVYDDFKRSVDPRNFAGRVVFEQFNEETGSFNEEHYPLTAVAGSAFLSAELPSELPSEFFAAVWLAGKETRFDFYFEEITVEPPGGSSFLLTRAGPHTHERPPLYVPEQPPAIVAEIESRNQQLAGLVESRSWLTLYLPAFDAKDLAEALLGRLDGLAVRERGRVRRGISRVMQSAVEIERAGDLADEPRVRRALERFRDGVADIVDVFPTAGR